MRVFQSTPRPTNSPWDQVQQSAELGPGIWEVSTAGHGGFLISAERRAAMPAYLRNAKTYAGGNAYEEDCDWILIALAWPELFTPKHATFARDYLLSYDRTEEKYPGELASDYSKSWQAAARTLKAQESQGALAL